MAKTLEFVAKRVGQGDNRCSSIDRLGGVLRAGRRKKESWNGFIEFSGNG